MPSRITFAGDKTLTLREPARDVAAALRHGPAQLHRDDEGEAAVQVFPRNVLYVEDYNPNRAAPSVKPG